jgi:hypothetical protein
MRKRSVKMCAIVLAAASMAIGAASVARADERIVAKVPFAFIVGNVRLPAGSYVVKEDMSTGAGVLAIQSADGRRSVYTLTIPYAPNRGPADPELVFEKFNDQYFLFRIIPTDGSDREIVLSPRVMQHELAEVALNP